MLQGVKVIDLTIPLGVDVIMWPGAPAPEVEVLGTVKHDGFFARRVSFFEHTGTHFDAPSHFVDEAATTDKIPVASLVQPAVVIDISKEIAGDPDALLTMDHIKSFELVHGTIPAKHLILLRTGWEDFNRDREKYAGPEGDLHFPGFGEEAASYLVNDREASGLGIDTLGIDPGNRPDFPVHSQISHPKGLWHLENLQNLKDLPALGAWIIVGVLPLVGGSGSPARVIALVP